MSEYNRLNYSAGILGIGKCVPDKILTNKDLENMVDTSNEWILQRTGISERRIIDNNMPLYELGSRAARDALKNASLKPEMIDLIIATTETPDYLTPSMACLIQRCIGATNSAAFDLNAACTGSVYGLTIASQFILSGYYKYVLLVSCEGLSRVVDWNDRNTCVLFGDGAAAMVVGQVEKGYGILATHIGADGFMGHNITIGKSKGVEGDNGPLAQVDTVMAAVGFTADGKVAAAIIDNAQTRVSFDKDGKLTSDPNAEYKTKVELGDDYGMKKQSQIGKEWYEQIAELEKWMSGKTIDEIKSMKTVEKDASHPAVPDEPELSSQVTISVQDYIAAVAEAFDKAK